MKTVNHIKKFKVSIVCLTGQLFLTAATFAGGDISGGGDVSSRFNAERSVVRNQILALTGDLQYIFRQISLAYGSRVVEARPCQDDDLFCLLFSGKGNGLTVFDVLPTLQFTPKENGPCFDREGKEVDASAFNVKPNEVCISLDRVVPQLRSEEVNVAVWALGVHEVSHRLGASEKAAREIQSGILSHMTARSLIRANQEVLPLLRGQIGQIVEELKRAVKKHGWEWFSSKKFCNSLKPAADTAVSIHEQVMSQFDKVLASPLRKIDSDRIEALVRWTIMTYATCMIKYTENSDDEMSDLVSSTIPAEACVDPSSTASVMITIENGVPVDSFDSAYFRSSLSRQIKSFGKKGNSYEILEDSLRFYPYINFENGDFQWDHFLVNVEGAAVLAGKVLKTIDDGTLF